MFGEVLEKGQGLADSASKAVKKQVADSVKATASQVGGGVAGTDQTGAKTPSVDENFVKDLYGIEDQTQQQSSQTKTTNPAQNSNVGQAQDPKKAEDQQKLVELRKKLHMETYYEPTFNPPKEKPEERPAEKVEKEKIEEQQELQQKEAKKPEPLAVKRAQRGIEANRGASG